MEIKYRMTDDLSGMYGIQPLNQDSLELLDKIAHIPTYCWLGNICYVDGRVMQKIVNSLEQHEGITIITDNSNFVSNSDHN